MSKLTCLILSILMVELSTTDAMGAAAVAAAGGAGSAPEAAQSGRHKLMGVEIETSVIKTNSWDVRFLVETKGNPFWVLEGDTRDLALRGADYASYDLNVECHTKGGIGKKEIREAAEEIQNVLQTIYDLSPTSIHLTSEAFRTFLLREGKGKSVERILKATTSSSIMSFKNKGLELSKRLVRPQITYQLPLEEIPRIFGRLDFLKHRNVPYFLRDLDSTMPFHGVDSHTLVEKLKGTPLEGMLGKLSC